MMINKTPRQRLEEKLLGIRACLSGAMGEWDYFSFGDLEGLAFGYTASEKSIHAASLLLEIPMIVLKQIDSSVSLNASQGWLVGGIYLGYDIDQIGFYDRRFVFDAEPIFVLPFGLETEGFPFVFFAMQATNGKEYDVELSQQLASEAVEFSLFETKIQREDEKASLS